MPWRNSDTKRPRSKSSLLGLQKGSSMKSQSSLFSARCRIGVPKTTLFPQSKFFKDKLVSGLRPTDSSGSWWRLLKWGHCQVEHGRFRFWKRGYPHQYSKAGDQASWTHRKGQERPHLLRWRLWDHEFRSSGFHNQSRIRYLYATRYGQSQNEVSR